MQQCFIFRNRKRLLKRAEGENGKLEKTRGLDFSVPPTLNTS